MCPGTCSSAPRHRPRPMGGCHPTRCLPLPPTKPPPPPPSPVCRNGEDVCGTTRGDTCMRTCVSWHKHCNKKSILDPETTHCTMHRARQRVRRGRAYAGPGLSLLGTTRVQHIMQEHHNCVWETTLIGRLVLWKKKIDWGLGSGTTHRGPNRPTTGCPTPALFGNRAVAPGQRLYWPSL